MGLGGGLWDAIEFHNPFSPFATRALAGSRVRSRVMNQIAGGRNDLSSGQLSTVISVEIVAQERSRTKRSVPSLGKGREGQKGGLSSTSRVQTYRTVPYRTKSKFLPCVSKSL